MADIRLKWFDIPTVLDASIPNEVQKDIIDYHTITKTDADTLSARINQLEKISAELAAQQQKQQNEKLAELEQQANAKAEYLKKLVIIYQRYPQGIMAATEPSATVTKVLKDLFSEKVVSQTQTIANIPSAAAGLVNKMFQTWYHQYEQGSVAIDFLLWLEGAFTNDQKLQDAINKINRYIAKRSQEVKTTWQGKVGRYDTDDLAHRQDSWLTILLCLNQDQLDDNTLVTYVQGEIRRFSDGIISCDYAALLQELLKAVQETDQVISQPVKTLIESSIANFTPTQEQTNSPVAPIVNSINFLDEATQGDKDKKNIKHYLNYFWPGFAENFTELTQPKPSLEQVPQKDLQTIIKDINQYFATRAKETNTGWLGLFGYYSADDYHKRRESWVKILLLLNKKPINKSLLVSQLIAEQKRFSRPLGCITSHICRQKYADLLGELLIQFNGAGNVSITKDCKQYIGQSMQIFQAQGLVTQEVTNFMEYRCIHYREKDKATYLHAIGQARHHYEQVRSKASDEFLNLADLDHTENMQYCK